ncbi:aldo/keto reductase, partial [Rossellomorea aquimaris]|uniref:aldo/keto reductase n=1 Tax=Rossellomorea aquimaris TaxID=189382 RepID=UPI0014962287
SCVACLCSPLALCPFFHVSMSSFVIASCFLLFFFFFFVNTTTPIEVALELEHAHPDLSLSATQYTLLQHERALERMMPLAEKTEGGLVIGSAFNSGALLGGDHFDYAEITPEIKQRVARFHEVAQNHGVQLKDAALQFSTAHPAVKAVVTGSTRPDRIKEDLAALKA